MKSTILTVVLPGTQQVNADGFINVPAKTLAGLEAYERFWPGSVELAFRGASADDGFGLGASWRDPSTLPIRTHILSDLEELEGLAGDRLLLLPHHPEFASLLKQEHAVVLTSELPAAEVLKAELLTTSTVLDRARVTGGAARRELALRKMAKAADGLQCNGWPSWDAYAKLSRRPLRYYDTRLTSAHVDRPRARGFAEDGVLRLAFSGRLFANKGPSYALELSAVLESRGFDHELLVIGDGPDREKLRQRAPSNVVFVEPMDFSTDWVQLMLERVDIGVLPHMQGDPSGTYLEMSGLGVPVIGFKNAALAGLQSHDGVGWACGLRDVNALADEVQRLRDDPEEWRLRSEHGRRFMSRHDFEREFKRRINHIQEAAFR